jgi:glycosyltransferase involved in cell wall biosynthesis
MLIAQVNVARNFRGGERQTELLMTELGRMGVEQCLVARRNGALANRMKNAGFEVREVSGQIPGVVRATRGVDLVHVHEGRSIYAAYLRRLLSGTPYVATRRVNNPIGEHRFAHLAYRGAAKVVGVAPQVADVVREFDSDIDVGVILSASSGLKADPEQVRSIREAAGNGFIVGHVGALDNDQKAQDTIIEAARQLSGSHPDVHFILVGGGEDEAMLRELAAGLDNLTFTGFVDNVGDYLGAFDIFILPSRREGIGSILFDAMEYSLPVVVTPVGGVPRIVLDGQNGFLIGVEKPDELVDRILRLRLDAGLREKMGAQGRQMAVGHTPPDMAEAYLRIYRSILDR